MGIACDAVAGTHRRLNMYIIGPRNGAARGARILQYMGIACDAVAGIHMYIIGPRNGVARGARILQYMGITCDAVARHPYVYHRASQGVPVYCNIWVQRAMPLRGTHMYIIGPRDVV